MSETDGDEHQAIAERILGKAIDALIAEGIDYTAACHCLIIMGLDSLPGGVCRACLPAHYGAVRDRVETRIEEIPNLVPGRDCAISCGELH